MFFKKTFYVYVLMNLRTNGSYVGHTSALERRIVEHNTSDLNPRRYTRRMYGPWELVYREEYPSRSEAMAREKFLKSGRGR